MWGKHIYAIHQIPATCIMHETTAAEGLQLINLGKIMEMQSATASIYYWNIE